jgi:hypothetical protein
MPTEFNWRKPKEEQNKPEPVPEPNVYVINLGFFMFTVLFMFLTWNFISEAQENIKIIDHCSELQGVPIRTLRGDTVCIKQDVLTDVLRKSETKK